MLVANHIARFGSGSKSSVGVAAPLALMALLGGTYAIADSADGVGRPAPKSIQALGTQKYDGAFVRERELTGDPSYRSYLISYRSSGLKVYAFVAEPRAAAPVSGFPVVIANHGFHPNPPKYGTTAAGIDSRPGDYYRNIPKLYADQGFMVVMPDYRGHSNSEGAIYTKGLLASAYYTEDVLALAAVVRKLADVDARNLFLWGHSMGGEVTLRAALAGAQFRAASLWSSVGGDIWDQAYYYSRYESRETPDSSEISKKEIAKLRNDISSLRTRFDWRSVEPLLHLDGLQVPLIIQHSIGDQGANYNWSERLAKELSLRDKKYEFYSYPGDEHLFSADVQVVAAQRDADFFRQHEQKEGR